jgi:hypothetical protein
MESFMDWVITEEVKIFVQMYIDNPIWRTLKIPMIDCARRRFLQSRAAERSEERDKEGEEEWRLTDKSPEPFVKPQLEFLDNLCSHEQYTKHPPRNRDSHSLGQHRVHQKFHRHKMSHESCQKSS